MSSSTKKNTKGEILTFSEYITQLEKNGASKPYISIYDKEFEEEQFNTNIPRYKLSETSIVRMKDYLRMYENSFKLVWSEYRGTKKPQANTLLFLLSDIPNKQKAEIASAYPNYVARMKELMVEYPLPLDQLSCSVHSAEYKEQFNRLLGQAHLFADRAQNSKWMSSSNSEVESFYFGEDPNACKYFIGEFTSFMVARLSYLPMSLEQIITLDREAALAYRHLTNLTYPLSSHQVKILENAKLRLTMGCTFGTSTDLLHIRDMNTNVPSYSTYVASSRYVATDKDEIEARQYLIDKYSCPELRKQLSSLLMNNSCK
jgi:hypothetical protein